MVISAYPPKIDIGPSVPQPVIGDCPKQLFGGMACLMVVLDDKCTNDEGCPAGKKCCKIGCEPRQCMDPVGVLF